MCSLAQLYQKDNVLQVSKSPAYACRKRQYSLQSTSHSLLRIKDPDNCDLFVVLPLRSHIGHCIVLTDTLLCVDHQQQVILKSIKLSDATRLIDCCRIAAALIPWCEAQKFHVYQLACDNWILLREVIQTICINNTGNTAAAVQTLRGQISICFQCWSVHAWLALQKTHPIPFFTFSKTIAIIISNS